MPRRGAGLYEAGGISATIIQHKSKHSNWYVDNFHKDGSVHLEVFRMSDGSFMGTCDIEDVNKFRAATKKEAAKKEPLKF